MKRTSEWDEFLDNLLFSTIEQYRETTEYEYIKKQEDEIDILLRDNLTTDQKEMVDECLFEFGIIAERECNVLYRQGLKDCVWLLKSLGVL